MVYESKCSQVLSSTFYCQREIHINVYLTAFQHVGHGEFDLLILKGIHSSK